MQHPQNAKIVPSPTATINADYKRECTIILRIHVRYFFVVWTIEKLAKLVRNINEEEEEE